MIPPLSIKMLADHTKNLERRLKALQKQRVTIGYFASQGEHYSGFTYPELMSYQSGGDPSRRMPARPVIHIAFAFNPLSKSGVKQNLTKYLSKIKHTNAPIKVTKITEDLGMFYREKIYQTFGSSKLAANSAVTQELKSLDGVSPPNSPLIWKGDLKSKISYKINGETVKEHG